MKKTEIKNNFIGTTEYQIEAEKGFTLVKNGFNYGKGVVTDDPNGWKEVPEEE